MMVGRAVQAAGRQGRRPTGRRRCSRSRASPCVDPRGHQVVKDVSFEARAGEVLGIAGVQGNGQTELIKALLGLVRPDAGAIRLDGEDISKHGPRESLDDGIGYIPEDRSHDGFVGAFSVRENLVLDLYRSDAFSRGLALKLDDDRGQRRPAGSRSSTSAPSPPSTPVVVALRRQPAEGRRGARVLRGHSRC